MHWELHHDHVVMVPFSVLCRLDLTPKLPAAKHGMGTVSWLNAETLERTPIPHFGRQQVCKVHHGHLMFVKYLNAKFMISGWSKRIDMVCSAVLLVWGPLRLIPISYRLLF